mmetsp:Transcript_23004/g.35552  ORF Transcript_23004/g.35552 Transcript_23004/m.35552 type:complete len:138 (+) Transcript_23004:1538-1951(+)
MDVRLNEAGKREDYVDGTEKRLEKLSNIVFTTYKCSAYIGRALKTLKIYIDLPWKRQMIPQILHSLLFIDGELLAYYFKSDFKAVLEKIISVWEPAYTQYAEKKESGESMFLEFINQPKYFADVDSFADLTDNITGV